MTPPRPVAQAKRAEQPIPLNALPQFNATLIFWPCMPLVRIQKFEQLAVGDTIERKARPHAPDRQKALLKETCLPKKWVPTFILQDPACLGPKLGHGHAETGPTMLFDTGLAIALGATFARATGDFILAQDACNPKQETNLGSPITLSTTFDRLTDGQKT